jgi:excisionase family DNA binding protein
MSTIRMARLSTPNPSGERKMSSLVGTHDYTTTGPPRLVDIKELSRILSIPVGTLYNWVYFRRIPFIKAGRSLRFDPIAVMISLPHFG